MQPGDLLPCTQQPANGPYPEPDESNPHLPTKFPRIHSNIILQSIPSSLEWSQVSNQHFVCVCMPAFCRLQDTIPDMMLQNFENLSQQDF